MRPAAFPVVGVLGPHEALMAFFAALPADSGCAFVAISAEGVAMVDMRAATTLRTQAIGARARLRPDSLYASRAGRRIWIVEDRLLAAPAPAGEPPGDPFLRALADERRDLSAAVLLDPQDREGGFAGAAAVKAQGGLVATVPGGFAGADLVGAPEALATAVVDYFRAVHGRPPPVLHGAHGATADIDAGTLTPAFLTRTGAVAALLVDGLGDIHYVCGQAGRFIEPAAGLANWNLFAMARGALAQALEEALPEALGSDREARRSGLAVKWNGMELVADVLVEPLAAGSGYGLALVGFFASISRTSPPAAGVASRRR